VAAKAHPPGRGAPARGERPVNTAGFTKVEEEFFARESELHAPQAVDTFDDLEPTGDDKKGWFRFGSRKPLSTPKAPPKKR
jgi:hypothetical protein